MNTISQWITDLNIKPKTIKLLKKNIGEFLGHLEVDRYFVVTENHHHKKKIWEMRIKIQELCSSKHSKPHWKKISTNPV